MSVHYPHAPSRRRRTVTREFDRWVLDRQVRLVAGMLVLVVIVVSVFAPAARSVAGAVLTLASA